METNDLRSLDATPARARVIAALRDLRGRELTMRLGAAEDEPGEEPDVTPEPGQPSPSLPFVPQPPVPETPHVPSEPEPKRYPIHPEIPTQPIHEPEKEPKGS